MKTRNLAWAIENLSMSRFLVRYQPSLIGELQFDRLSYHDASYKIGGYQLEFLEEDNEIFVASHGKTIGKISYTFFGEKKLVLTDSSEYVLSHNLFGRNVRWLDVAQNIHLALKQPTLRDIGRGEATLNDDLPEETKQLLISSALYLHNLYSRKSSIYAILVAAILPVLIVLFY